MPALIFIDPDFPAVADVLAGVIFDQGRQTGELVPGEGIKLPDRPQRPSGFAHFTVTPPGGFAHG